MKRLAFAMIMGAAACAAQAQAIYRCGQTYSQTPCPDGRIIDSSDPRTAAQRVAAKRAAAKEKQLAAKMETERRAQESAQAASQAASTGTSVAPPVRTVVASAPANPKHKSKTKSHKAKAASGADFTAIVPSSAGKPISK